MRAQLSRLARVLAALAVLAPVAAVGANFLYPFNPALDRTPAYVRSAFFTGSFPFIVPYLLFVPKDYDAGRNYPLVLVLHAAKKRALEADILASPSVQARYPSFVLMPMAPFRRVWALPEAPEFRRLENPALPLAMRMLGHVRGKYAIDESRIYVTGASVGGFGVFGALIQYPETFAGAVSVCGGWQAADAARVPPVAVWLFHSDDDPQIPVRYSRDIVTAVNERGGRARYTEFSGVGHAAWGAAFGNPALWDWLFAQRRNG